MKLAIQEAKKGLGKTFTNPLVGAVIVDGTNVISKGAHLAYGQAHAERHVIDSCQTPEKLFNSTLYVTLEPCNHYGKQPPCTQAIIDAGIKRVIIGQLDPNPLVAGKGVKKLRSNGIQVISGVLAKEVRTLNRAYNHFFEKQRPLMTLKQAISLDGKTALLNQRISLTQSPANELVHEERGHYQAVLVGSGTVLTDNPSLLTTRLTPFPPIRIVLDRRGRTLKHTQLTLFKNSGAPVLILTETAHQVANLPEHVTVQVLPHMTIAAVCQELYRRKIQSVYVEGGATIHDAFLAADCWDEIICYLAPILLGGNSLPSMSSTRLGQRYANLNFTNITQVGPDLRIVARRQ